MMAAPNRKSLLGFQTSCAYITHDPLTRISLKKRCPKLGDDFFKKYVVIWYFCFKNNESQNTVRAIWSKIISLLFCSFLSLLFSTKFFLDLIFVPLVSWLQHSRKTFIDSFSPSTLSFFRVKYVHNAGEPNFQFHI